MNIKKERTPAELPSAIKNFEEISENIKRHKPLIFLDFDGTLAPIVEHHADAAISSEMKGLVEKLAKKFSLAVVSGRGLADVSKKAGIDNIYYAGSHGYEISGPNGFSKDHEEAEKVLPVFEKIEPMLKEELKHIQGVDFERKKFTLAVHYRQVAKEHEQEVHDLVLKTVSEYPELSKAEGKKVIEIKPSIDWHKGKAVEFLKSQLGAGPEDFSIYVGDDVTDEDAFKYVKNNLGILVGEHSQNTYADYGVQDLEEVKELFREILKLKV
ncbi:trehalose-phosphatase [Antarcticibacterium flavum]|uniref:Trehalose 6-phosphate phosphatase n=1 Tax=Antarcticibacterium flavum TaxID=2058175 RepID=A0A5B7X0H1_9FLAO|nr:MULTISPECIES: trehalose-phosphatase [Antarcticibacterium]MCM4159823.1 trehalose-phosphatase [Antarcticibacterium sp. W02-3]QCY68829.1 trehalose-phosphatase [Antarcticibacterium flavum]